MIYKIFIKRLIDLSIAFFIIIITSPIFFIILFLIFFYDYKNPIYKGKRVGLNGILFYQYKFRSMKILKLDNNFLSTSASDIRITPIGHFIRKYKIDELPQLFNVLIGNMSLVGPRPNVEEDVKKYISDEKSIIFTKPGITDLSSIIFSDEGEILKNSSNPDESYNLLIRPWKSSLILLYIKNESFLLDCQIIFLTLLNFFNREKTLRLIHDLVKKKSPNNNNLHNICLRKEKLLPININTFNFIS
jgi:lipopolysaccharide/colanic/teichoic acid biosynthesis glycosyltransferase